MSAKVFVDTNILVYTRDRSEPDKQTVAKKSSVEPVTGCTSLQGQK